MCVQNLTVFIPKHLHKPLPEGPVLIWMASHRVHKRDSELPRSAQQCKGTQITSTSLKLGILAGFWCNSSLLSTSDCIAGDDIILENSCRLKAASGSNDCVFIVIYLSSGKQTEVLFFFFVPIACITLLIIVVVFHCPLKPKRGQRSGKES